MKIVGLVSGGKDSIFSLMECKRLGHEIICLAHLTPPTNIEELDSWMFQSVGSNLAQMMGECFQLPIYIETIKGKSNTNSNSNNLAYETTTENDEVEDLFRLIQKVKSHHPDIEGISTGAILSDYQRLRVENVCQRHNLVSFAYLWQRDQSELLDQIIKSGLKAILVKVAGMGLDPHKHLNKELSLLQTQLSVLNQKYGVHVCGEGGEYETITLDCPLFKKRIVIDESEIIIHSDDYFAPVGFLRVKKFHLEDKKNDSNNILEEQTNILEHSNLNKDDNDDNNNNVKNINQIKVSRLEKNYDLLENIIVKNENDGYQNNKDEEEYCFIEKGFRVNDQAYAIVTCGSCSVLSNSNDPSDYVKQETNKALLKLKDILESKCSGMKIDNVEIIWLYISDLKYFSLINSIYISHMPKLPPSRICVELKQNCLIKIICFSNSKSRQKTIHVQSISHWAPASIGPYSQAVKSGNQIIHTAGSIALDSSLMKLINTTGLDNEQIIRAQTVKCLENLEPVITVITQNPAVTGEEFLLKNILRAEIYLLHSSNDEIFSTYILEEWIKWTKKTDPWPKSKCTPLIFSVSRLPRDSSVEISLSLLPFCNLQNSDNDSVDNEDIVNYSNSNSYLSLENLRLNFITETIKVSNQINIQEMIVIDKVLTNESYNNNIIKQLFIEEVSRIQNFVKQYEKLLSIKIFHHNSISESQIINYLNQNQNQLFPFQENLLFIPIEGIFSVNEENNNYSLIFPIFVFQIQFTLE
eukprot:c21565_g1_i2.p1 GENE.c21565_g1_i2~~c21565_g1_i2.p1  ORF type:complete len:753 (-),score=239.29 c21565_g1_i2:83-2341(-)